MTMRPTATSRPETTLPRLRRTNFVDPIGHRVGPGADGLVGEEAPQILCECRDGNVTLRRVFLERLAENGVEVAFESAAPRDRCAGDRGGTRRLLLENGMDQLGRGTRAAAQRVRTGQEHVKYEAERVYVGCRGDGLAQKLLRRSVLGSQRLGVGLSEGGVAVLSEQLRNAEIEQLYGAFAGDEDVCRLQVAMNDEMAVRVANRSKHALEQGDSCFEAKFKSIAVSVDRLTLDIFEHEVGLRIVDDPGIDEARDIGMIQPAEHSALAAESLFSGPAEPVGMDELDRDRSLESPIGSAGSPDAAHAAPTDFGFDEVGADAAADEGHVGDRCVRIGRVGQELGVSLAIAHRERPLNFGGDLGVRACELREPRPALRLRQLESTIEVIAEDAPLLLR